MGKIIQAFISVEVLDLQIGDHVELEMMPTSTSYRYAGNIFYSYSATSGKFLFFRKVGKRNAFGKTSICGSNKTK